MPVVSIHRRRGPAKHREIEGLDVRILGDMIPIVPIKKSVVEPIEVGEKGKEQQRCDGDREQLPRVPGCVG